jgi:hypothetical protein
VRGARPRNARGHLAVPRVLSAREVPGTKARALWAAGNSITG